jgi:glycosyltransferase involved in cell wall biosynthesis
MISQQQTKHLGSEMMSQVKPIRVLHIVENLNDQAVEAWLLRVLGAAAKDHSNLDWTFFCSVGKEGRLDDAARRLGAEVIHSRYDISDKVRFMRSLRKVMTTGGYAILHCHHDIMSAAYLAASAGLPFRKRIVHVHNTALNLPTSNRVKTELVREPMRQICLRMADQIVGISSDALESLIGKGSYNPAQHYVVHYAVDTESFSAAPIDRETFRRELGFNAEAKILLFVGRLTDYKNPLFVIDILEHAAASDKNVVAMFAGVGDEAQSIMNLAEEKSLSERVRLLGFRDDVPNLMVNSDVLIWPSVEEPKEGLGLGIVEAQAANLPILMSRSVPEEAIVVPELVEVLPLAAGAEQWANAVLRVLSRPRLDRNATQNKMASSSFSMAAGVSSLVALYDDI